jgi:hypothetical protein
MLDNESLSPRMQLSTNRSISEGGPALADGTRTLGTTVETANGTNVDSELPPGECSRDNREIVKATLEEEKASTRLVLPSSSPDEGKLRFVLDNVSTEEFPSFVKQHESTLTFPEKVRAAS